VISESGSAVGVVSQENTLMHGAAPITFVSAVLSCYLRDVA